MIYLRAEPESCMPRYMTAGSSGADLVSRSDMIIPVGKVVAVPTGVWIDRVDHHQVGPDEIPELQVRARSGLAYKNSICLANGVGTIDADYPDEIRVLLHNFGSEEFLVKSGDRIAQIFYSTVKRISGLPTGGNRSGGFGSTG